jgi:hypothetical protein
MIHLKHETWADCFRIAPWVTPVSFNLETVKTTWQSGREPEKKKKEKNRTVDRLHHLI